MLSEAQDWPDKYTPPGPQRPDNIFVLASKMPRQDNSKGPATPDDFSRNGTGQENLFFKQ